MENDKFASIVANFQDASFPTSSTKILDVRESLTVANQNKIVIFATVVD